MLTVKLNENDQTEPLKQKIKQFKPTIGNKSFKINLNKSNIGTILSGYQLEFDKSEDNGNSQNNDFQNTKHVRSKKFVIS